MKKSVEKLSQFKGYLWDILKPLIKKLALTNLLRIGGGLKGLLASFLIEKVINKIIKPAYLFIFRKIRKKIYKKEVDKQVEAIKNAKTKDDIKSAFDKLS